MLNVFLLGLVGYKHDIHRSRNGKVLKCHLFAEVASGNWSERVFLSAVTADFGGSHHINLKFLSIHSGANGAFTIVSDAPRRPKHIAQLLLSDRGRRVNITL